MDTYQKIPYSIASYKTIRQENYYYIDKTRFLPLLEGAGKFLFLIRPRRFGKSSLLTVLESYYDIARPEEWDLLFKGTDIYAHPTPEHHAYLILKFNFSQVDPRPEHVEPSFRDHTDDSFFFFGKKYRQYLDDDYFEMMERRDNAHSKMHFLLNYLSSKRLKLYLLIDEYDNFANTILTTAGMEAYHELTHGTGFFRFFFNMLKGATDQVESGIGRMFITGVSPVTMDDVTSGFNIGTHISLNPEFNELLGFTDLDLHAMLNYYRRHANLTLSDYEETIALMRDWYGHYQFAPDAECQMLNPNMVWYFMDHLLRRSVCPEDMVDQNVKIDYGKLRHLLVLNQRLNGNFDYLRQIIQEQTAIPERIVRSFPVERLTKPSNFLSLLFYFGLLSYAEDGGMAIPNQTVRQLTYSYLRDGYEDVNVFSLDLWRLAGLMRAMAYQGDWEPVFRFLAAEVDKQTSIRDYLTGEKVIQTFLLAYLNVTDYYLTRSEEEMGKGFADLYLEPFWQKYPDVRHGYLMELKYVPRSEWSEARGRQELEAAQAQLRHYASDPRTQHSPQLICAALVFCGWELKIAQAM